MIIGMQLSLFDWKKTAPRRPSLNSKSLSRKIAEKMRDDIAHYCAIDRNDPEIENALNDVAEAIEHCDDDPYKTCKYLDDRKHWDCDGALLEVFEFVYALRHDAHVEEVREWVLTNGVVPQRTLGQNVVLKKHNEEMPAMIVSINEDQAKYGVTIAPTRGITFVNFEDVV